MVVALLLPPAAAAAGGGRVSFAAKSFGEGGAYKHPDPAAGGFLESVPRLGRPLPKTVVDDVSTRPQPPRVLETVSSPQEGLLEPSDLPSADNGSYSLPGDEAAAEEEVAADAASDEARRDYDSRILGLEDEPVRPRLEDPAEAPRVVGGLPAVEEGRLFVSLELDVRQAGSLRDAVAGLGAAAGFAADARFAPLMGPTGVSTVSGWLPVSKLASAVSQPGVKRVRVETHPTPFQARELAGEFLVGFRVDDPSRTAAILEAGVRDLRRTAGFRSTRPAGIETSADGRSVVMVSGFLPLSRLSRAMGRPGVVKIVPLPTAPEAGASPARRSGARGFILFVAERGFWLVLLTLVLALPFLRRGASRALSVFVPYR